MKNNKGGYGVVFQDIMRNPDLPPYSKLLYAYLSSFAGKKGICYPSKKCISHDLKITEGTVHKYIQPLVDQGFLRIERKKEHGLLTNNIYHIIHGSCDDTSCDDTSCDDTSCDDTSCDPLSTQRHVVKPYTNNKSINNTNINNNSNNINTPSDDSSNKDDNNNIFNTTSTTTVRRENDQGDEERKFTPPTLAELMEYKDYYPKVNLYKFFEHYDGNGWIKKDGSPVDSLKTTLTQCNIGHRDYI